MLPSSLISSACLVETTVESGQESIPVVPKSYPNQLRIGSKTVPLGVRENISNNRQTLYLSGFGDFLF